MKRTFYLKVLSFVLLLTMSYSTYGTTQYKWLNYRTITVNVGEEVTLYHPFPYYAYVDPTTGWFLRSTYKDGQENGGAKIVSKNSEKCTIKGIQDNTNTSEFSAGSKLELYCKGTRQSQDEEYVCSWTIIVKSHGSIFVDANPNYGIWSSPTMVAPGTKVYLTARTSDDSSASDAKIYYTTDEGSFATENSTPYTSAGITINKKTYISAIASKSGYNPVTCGGYYDVRQDIMVTSITLNKTSLSLEAGKEETLTPTVLPTNATDKTVAWSSSNTSVATVDNDGNVMAKAIGNATITCMAKDGSNVKATCEVTVTQTQAYAVLSNDGKTVTFYYDDKKESRGGVDIRNSQRGTATTAVFDTSFANYRPTSTAYWFSGCSELTTIKGMENLYTDDVTDMEFMFYNCNNLTNLNIKGFNTEKVTSMYGMFCRCLSLEKLDVSGFKMDNVTNTNRMFASCNRLTTLELSNFNTSNVKDMTRMFGSCKSLTTVYVNEKKWNTANVTEGDGVFAGCTVLVGGNGTKFDESHTNVEYARIDKAGSPGYFTDIADSKVTGITLNKTKLSLQTNQVETLTATVMPDNALDKTVTWSSSNTNVATVDDSGKVIAISAGTATITCTANGGSNVKATCEVTVTNPKPEKIILPAEATVTAGNAITLTPTTTPADAVYTLTWTSDDESIATVDANGVVTGIKKGQTFINVETDNGKTAYCKLTVTEPEKKVTSITLNMSTMSLVKGKSQDLYPTTIEPENATDKTVTWSSSNDKVATVDANGKVVAVADGDATITCTANDGSGVSASCVVTVKLVPDFITLASPVTVVSGQTITLTPEITPANAVTTLTWTSDDETIATVDANGVVTGIKKGQTFINVETDNGKTTYCKLTVTAPEPVEIILPKNATVIVGEPLKLTPTLTPEDAETVLTWYSDDETIVRVTADGTLIGVAEGLAIVTAKASNGITSNACKVKVELPSAISDVQTDIKAKTPIYTVSGQRIKTLRKGINIVGGKKVVIK